MEHDTLDRPMATMNLTGRENIETDKDGDDPLQVRQLALNYDYLMYKIQDHTIALSEKVAQNVDYTQKQNEDAIARIHEHIAAAKLLISECDRTNEEIDKLEQLQLMTRDFKDRLRGIDKRLKQNAKRYGH